MQEIFPVVELLSDARLVNFGRSCNLLWFMFEKEDHKYFLHAQCWVRILAKDKILATSGDIFEPSIVISNADNFLWEKFGDSLYDYSLLNCNELLGSVICKISSNNSGDVKITLSSGLEIQLLFSSTNKTEMWRVFEKKSSSHYVYDGYLSIE